MKQFQTCHYSRRSKYYDDFGEKFQIHRKCSELYFLYGRTNYIYDLVCLLQQQLFCEFEKIPPIMLNHIINELIDFCCLLQGKRLNIVTKQNDYQVYVGSGECIITKLTESELMCHLPFKEPSPRLNEDKLFIRVSSYFFCYFFC